MNSPAFLDTASSRATRLEPDEAHPRQLSVYRLMTPGQRLAMADEMTAGAFALQEAAVRSFHPEWTEAEVQRELKRRRRHDPG